MSLSLLQKHLAYWMLFNEMKGVTTSSILDLLNRYGGLESAFLAYIRSKDALPIRVVKDRGVQSWERLAALYLRAVQTAERDQVRILTAIGKGYPKRLMKIPNMPPTLFVRGNADALNAQKAVAIVGTRKPSAYGRKKAYQIAHGLAKSGYVIISGLAFGIDTQAHLGALDAQGTTVAVLASYVCNIVPKSNQDIAERILSLNGAIASEYPPGTKPTRDKFVYRNRLIAALTDATIIVEGYLRSGTRHQASYSRELHRRIFVVSPDDRQDPQAELPLYLERRGAEAIESANDFLEAMESTKGDGIEGSKVRM